jgi:iron complex transport system ATP-binding protein
MSAPLLDTQALDVAIGDRVLCRGLDWRVMPGESWAILGRNGAGKSTLLATLAGLREPASGEVSIGGRAAGTTSLRELALIRGYLPQQSHDPFASTVLETALVGRHPHLGRWDWESNADKRMAEAALAEVGLSGFAQRDVQTLSGGERQRLGIATLLVQQPKLFLLDEPLAHLDLNHQVAQMEVLAKRAAQGASVVAVLHDPGFAARWCDHALLLFGDGEWRAGPVSEIVTAENLSRLYHHPLRQLAGAPYPVFIPE